MRRRVFLTAIGGGAIAAGTARSVNLSPEETEIDYNPDDPLTNNIQGYQNPTYEGPTLVVGYGTGDDDIYAGTFVPGRMYAFGHNTGTVVWSRSAPITFSQSMVVSNGIIGIKNESGIQGFRLTDGERVWSVSYKGSFGALEYGGPVTDGQRLFYKRDTTGREGPEWGSNTVAVDLQTGEQKWEVQTSGKVSPLHYSDGTVYTQESDLLTSGRITAMDSETGDVLWDINRNGAAMAAPTRRNNRLFVQGFNQMTAHDVDTGQVVATGEVSVNFPDSGIAEIDETPLVTDNRVYYRGQSKHIHAMDYDLNEQWVTDESWSKEPSVTDQGNIVVAGSGDPSFAVYDPSGEILWSLSESTLSLNDPASGVNCRGDWAYFTDKWGIYAVNLQTRSAEWSQRDEKSDGEPTWAARRRAISPAIVNRELGDAIGNFRRFGVLGGRGV